MFKNKKIILVLAMLAFVLASPVRAEVEVRDKDLLLPYWQEKVEIFKSPELREKEIVAAEEEDAEAQYVIGYMYYNGAGVERDRRKGEKWYMRSAVNGYVPAQLTLAMNYREKKDITRALEWYHKAAKAGDPNAWYALGEFYEEGVGVFQSYEKAKKCYEIAAKGGVTNGIVKLALFYHQGRGVERDIYKAIEYYKLLEDKAGREYKLKISVLLAELYAEIADNEEDRKSAFEWNEKAASLGHLESELKIAEAYLYGIGADVDYTKAIEWYKRAADRGDTRAMQKLGYVNLNGLGVEIDYAKAAYWYQEAAERGDAEAAWTLGNLYFSGTGLPRDAAEAQKWFERARVLRDKQRFR